MSRILIVAAVMLAMAVPLRAQTHLSEAAGAQKARIDSLLPRWRAAGERLDHEKLLRNARQRAKLREPLDTLVMPPFVAVARRSESAKVFPAFRAAMRERQSFLSGLASAPPITLMFEGRGSYPDFHALANTPRHHVVSLLFGFRHRKQERIIGAAIEDGVRDLLPARVRNWLRDGRLSIAHPDAEVARELATVEAAVTKGCLAARLGDCMLALELTPFADSLRGWTAAELRHALARRQGAQTGAVRLCLVLQDDAACPAAFAGGPPLPLSTRARGTLLRYAIDQGGPGALARVAAFGDVSVAQAITVAAGRPVADVVRAWRGQLDDRKSATAAGLATNAVTGLFWIGLAVLLARRSTRRRLG